MKPIRGTSPQRGERARQPRPPLTVFPTTLWEYPSRHYDTWLDEGGRVARSGFAGNADAHGAQGSKNYAGATPSWVVWQLLRRYTRRGDTLVDPMCGSGTTLDVCSDLNRHGLGFDLSPSRPDIRQADARSLPLANSTADFVFIDPPYSTHIEYSPKEADIGRLDAGGEDGGRAYYAAMDRVIAEIDRVLKPGRFMALYVSDSFRKRKGKPGGRFMPIGFELFSMLTRRFEPADVIVVVRHNQKLARGNWRKAAEEGNFFLRGFNYLFIMHKRATPAGKRPGIPELP